jgi:mono/diheme cytochrome c family protein
MADFSRSRGSLTLSFVLVAAAGFAADGPAEIVALYEEKCMACHMADGKAAVEDMSLADAKWKHGSKPADIAKVIREGVEGTAMQPFKDQLTKQQIEALARYVRAFDKTLKPEPEGKKK